MNITELLTDIICNGYNQQRAKQTLQELYFALDRKVVLGEDVPELKADINCLLQVISHYE